MVTAPVQDPVTDSQLSLSKTRHSARWRLGFDVFFGIVAPLLCLYFDPGLMSGANLATPKILASLRLFAYLEIGISTALLAFYLLTRRGSSWLAGALYAGAFFALFVGILILPLALGMLLALIGIPGLTPLFTGYVFLSNARQCWQQSLAGTRAHRAPAVAVLSAILILGIPLSLQVSATREVNRAKATLQTGSEQEFDRALQTIKRLRFAVYIDIHRMPRDYQRSSDPVLRARLARVYRALTGNDIEQYLYD